jgi:hypothetical protein
MKPCKVLFAALALAAAASAAAGGGHTVTVYAPCVGSATRTVAAADFQNALSGAYSDTVALLP